MYRKKLFIMMILNFKNIEISDVISIPIYYDNLIKNKKKYLLLLIFFRI